MKQAPEAQSNSQPMDKSEGEQSISRVKVSLVCFGIEFLLFVISAWKEYAFVDHVALSLGPLLVFGARYVDKEPFFDSFGVVFVYGCFIYESVRFKATSSSLLLEAADALAQSLLVVMAIYYLILGRLEHPQKHFQQKLILWLVAGSFVVPPPVDHQRVWMLSFLLCVVSWNTQLMFRLLDPLFELSPQTAFVVSAPLVRLRQVPLVAYFAFMFALQTIKIYGYFSKLDSSQPLLEKETPPPEEEVVHNDLKVDVETPLLQNPPRPPPAPRRSLLQTQFVSSGVKPPRPPPALQKPPPPPTKPQEPPTPRPKLKGVFFSSYASDS